jgi:hypothetical protein
MKTDGSVDVPLRSQLLPKLSFRFFFGLTLVGAIVAATARAAGSGSEMASGVLAAILFLAMTMAAMVVVFLFSWLIAIFWYTADDEAPANPFAEGQLPPQILPPKDPVL